MWNTGRVKYNVESDMMCIGVQRSGDSVSWMWTCAMANVRQVEGKMLWEDMGRLAGKRR